MNKLIDALMVVSLILMALTLGINKTPDPPPKTNLTCLSDKNFCTMKQGNRRLCFWGDTDINCELYDKVKEILTKD